MSKSLNTNKLETIKKTTNKTTKKRSNMSRVQVGKPVALPSTIKKWSTIGMEEVIQYIADLILIEKKSHQTILKILQDEPYSFSQRHAYTLIKKSRKVIANQYKNWNINVLEETLADLAVQKEQAKVLNNHKLILEITKEENRIKGLYIEKQEIKQNITMKFEFDLGDETNEDDK